MLKKSLNYQMPKKSKFIDNEVAAKAEKALKSMGKQALLVKK